jgi:Protein of unknown function (DUF1501)
MAEHDAQIRAWTRRHFLFGGGLALGGVAFRSMLLDDLCASEPVKAPSGPHFPARARSVIVLNMDGGPSQLDLFDPKPKLQQFDGHPVPEEVIRGERFAFIKGVPKLLGSPYKFRRYGSSGIELSELLPHLAEVVDRIAVVRSVVTDQINHAPAQIFMATGHEQFGRPSMGSWVIYGLGSENQNLPAYVVLLSGGQPSAGKSCWGAGFLPSVYQGVEFRSQGDPVLFVSNPDGVDREARRASVELIKALDTLRLEDVGDPEIATRIAAYEMAFRMQASVPELTDLAAEPKSILQLYGVEPGKPSFAANCLLARRLVERGVRFVELYMRGWDSHGTSKSDDILEGLQKQCRESDRAMAALVRDLDQRGLLQHTLVVWGGEFGRTPMNEKRAGSKFFGRDHHPRAFTMWLAGGGVRRGVTIGTTDDLGYRVVEDPVHVHDLHATILHLLGLDHTRLTYRYQGRDFRLTDVHGHVVEKLLA